MNDKLELDGEHVATAVRADEAFDEGWVESTLTRALLASGFRKSGQKGLRRLGNGGCEVTVVNGGILRPFRLKKAVRDANGKLKILASSDSLLATGDPFQAQTSGFPELVPDLAEQWILAIVVKQMCISEATAAQAVGFVGSRPGRLRLANQERIPFGPDHDQPLSTFIPSQENLNLGTEEPDEDEGGGEGAQAE